MRKHLKTPQKLQIPVHDSRWSLPKAYCQSTNRFRDIPHACSPCAAGWSPHILTDIVGSLQPSPPTSVFMSRPRDQPSNSDQIAVLSSLGPPCGDYDYRRCLARHGFRVIALKASSVKIAHKAEDTHGELFMGTRTYVPAD